MPRKATASGAPHDKVRDRILSLPRRFRSGSANGLNAEWDLRVGSDSFTIAIADHACTVREGPCGSPVTSIVAEPEIWLAIDEGTLSGADAFLQGRLGLRGNLDLAVRLQTMFRPYRRGRRAADLDHIEVDAGGVKLSVFVAGRGDPMILLHGLGATKITWAPVLTRLAQSRRIVVPDLPGHGQSEKPRGDYSPRFHARVVRRLLDELEIERATIVGNSLGGRIALELALRSPGRVESLALFDPSVPGLRWRYILSFARIIPSEIGAIPFPLREGWVHVAIRRLFAHPEKLSPEAYSVAANEFIRINRDPRARMAFLASLRHIVSERPDVFFATLRRVKHPTLVLFGELDRLVPPRLGVRLTDHLPNAELVVLADVGHVPQFEATEETLDVLETFLKANG
jgi:pimeloyl-ACP methyl ester carboxylesterase/putative sterol carrier protein